MLTEITSSRISDQPRDKSCGWKRASMDGIQTMNHVAEKWVPMHGMSSLQTKNHLAKSGNLWMGCPLYKQ